MSEHLRDWKKLGGAMEPDWTKERAHEIKRRIALKKMEQQRRRIAVSIAAGFAVLLSATAVLLHRYGLEDAAESAENTTRVDIASRTSDTPIDRENNALQTPEEGSDIPPVATAVTADTKFEMKEETRTHTYRILSGAVRFDSGRKSRKRLKVKVGDIEIDDIGTIFTVEALPEGRAHIDVTEGRVLVTWPEGRTELNAGEQALFPPVRNRIAKDEGAAKALNRPESETSSDWRPYARRGDYSLAFDIIEASPSAVHNRVEDLLLAADVMRLSGRPKKAIGYLEKIIKEHMSDPRTNLAAFTAGRVFLDELGSPEQAARAFALAAKKGSPLAEEASAREVEAWSRAGEVDRARAAAQIYIQRYPGSARISVVRAFGGL